MPTTIHSMISNRDTKQPERQGQHGERLVAWNTWDDAEPTPATVEDHIDQYRKQLTKLRHQGAAAAAAAEACAEPDFFNVSLFHHVFFQNLFNGVAQKF